MAGSCGGGTRSAPPGPRAGGGGGGAAPRGAGRGLAAAEAQGVVLRLIGGLAVQMRARPMPPALARENGDIDTAPVKGQNRPVTDLLTALGYEPARQFNALNGSTRMLFHDRPNDRKL